MRIILKEDVKDLGRVGDVVQVARGYGRNYLLPRSLAVLATPGNTKDHEKRIKAAQEREVKERQEATALLDRVRDVRVNVIHRAAEGSTRLHGSITAIEIAEKLNSTVQTPRPIDRRDIVLRNPIRTLGDHTVTLRLGKAMTAQFVVSVQDENAAREAAAAAAAAAAAPPAAPVTNEDVDVDVEADVETEEDEAV